MLEVQPEKQMLEDGMRFGYKIEVRSRSVRLLAFRLRS